MKVVIVLLAVSLGAVFECSKLDDNESNPVPAVSPRIVGGQATNINSYPQIVSLQHRYFLFFWDHECGGTILTNRAIMTSAHCLNGWGAGKWRARVGSSYVGSGGTTYKIASIVIHPRYNRGAITNDIAIMHTNVLMTFTNSVQPARLPSNPNFVVANNKSVEAAGWGPVNFGGKVVDQLRRVDMYSVNQTLCALRYNMLGRVITENMLCAGLLDVGGRGTCGEDAGGPVYYNGIVVGLISYGAQCALPEYPSISTRITSYLSWIQSNA